MPTFKGVKCKRARHLGYRKSDPKKDKDLDGNPVESNYVSIVKISDCNIYEDNGKQYYNPNNAPCIPINYGATWYGYGRTRQRKQTQGRYFLNVIVYKYYTTPFYAVKDGVVYQGTIRNPCPPISYFKQNGYTYAEACILNSEARQKFNESKINIGDFNEILNTIC